jgi:hemolysin III
VENLEDRTRHETECRRPLHPREEVANSISHGLALILAVAALPVLLMSAMRAGNTPFAIGAAVFGLTIVILYLASTLYHSLTHTRAKEFCRHLDHCAIFC